MARLFFCAIAFLLTVTSTHAENGIGVPLIAEPVHAGLERVRVLHLNPGAMVRIERLVPAPDGTIPETPATQLLTERAARRDDDLFDFASPLKAGDVIRAVATEGTRSRTSPRAQVSATPTPLAAPRAGYNASLINEAKCMALEGLLPQGTGRVLVAGETDPIGIAVADRNGNAQVYLQRRVTLADKILLESALDTEPGTRTQVPLPVVKRGYLGLDPAYQEHYRAPVIVDPQDCDAFLTTEQHELGADYTITSPGVSDGPLFGPFCAISPRMTSQLRKDLSRSWGSVSAYQRYQTNMPWYVDTATIVPAKKPGAPKIGPVGEGAEKITVTNLRRSATVFVTQQSGGETFGPDEYNPATDGQFGLVRAARVGDRITVMQEFCGLKSNEDVAVVGAAPPSLAPVKPKEPVMACARSLQIEGVEPDTWIKGLVDDGTAISDLSSFAPPLKIGSGSETTYHMTPTTGLHPGWKVAARQRFGSTISDIDPANGWVTVQSAPETVTPPGLSDPSIPGLTIDNQSLVGFCNPVVEVTATRGATLAISTGGLLNTSAVAHRERMLVGLSGAGLRPGMTVQAAQSLCTISSDPSKTLRTVGKVRIHGPELNRAIAFDGNIRQIRLTVETDCVAPRDVVLNIAASDNIGAYAGSLPNKTVVKIAAAGGSWGDQATVIIPKGSDKADLFVQIHGRGRSRLEVTNWQTAGYVQTGPKNWVYNPASKGTEIAVSAWEERWRTVQMAEAPGGAPGVAGSLKPEPSYPVHIRKLSHRHPLLTLGFTDDLGQAGDWCAGGMWGLVTGIEGHTCTWSTCADMVLQDGDYISTVTPERYTNDDQLLACFQGGAGIAYPWEVKVTFLELIGPDAPPAPQP